MDNSNTHFASPDQQEESETTCTPKSTTSSGLPSEGGSKQSVISELGLSQVWSCVLMRGYDIEYVIGLGTYGTVVAASKSENRSAIKHIVIDDLQYPMVKTLREIKLL